MTDYNGSYGFSEYDYTIFKTRNELIEYVDDTSNILIEKINENKISNGDLLTLIETNQEDIGTHSNLLQDTLDFVGDIGQDLKTIFPEGETIVEVIQGINEITHWDTTGGNETNNDIIYDVGIPPLNVRTVNINTVPQPVFLIEAFLTLSGSPPLNIHNYFKDNTNINQTIHNIEKLLEEHQIRISCGEYASTIKFQDQVDMLAKWVFRQGSLWTAKLSTRLGYNTATSLGYARIDDYTENVQDAVIEQCSQDFTIIYAILAGLTGYAIADLINNTITEPSYNKTVSEDEYLESSNLFYTDIQLIKSDYLTSSDKTSITELITAISDDYLIHDDSNVLYRIIQTNSNDIYTIQQDYLTSVDKIEINGNITTNYNILNDVLSHQITPNIYLTNNVYRATPLIQNIETDLFYVQNKNDELVLYSIDLLGNQLYNYGSVKSLTANLFQYGDSTFSIIPGNRQVQAMRFNNSLTNQSFFETDNFTDQDEFNSFLTMKTVAFGIKVNPIDPSIKGSVFKVIYANHIHVLDIAFTTNQSDDFITLQYNIDTVYGFTYQNVNIPKSNFAGQEWHYFVLCLDVNDKLKFFMNDAIIFEENINSAVIQPLSVNLSLTTGLKIRVGDSLNAIGFEQLRIYDYIFLSTEGISVPYTEIASKKSVDDAAIEINNKIDELWQLKDSDAIVYQNNKKVEIGENKGTSGIKVYIPFNGVVVDIADGAINLYENISLFGKQLRLDNGNEEPLAGNNSKNGYYLYWGSDNGTYKRHVRYSLNSNNSENFQVSFWHTISSYISSGTQNNSRHDGVIFTTRKQQPIISETDTPYNDKGIEIKFDYISTSSFKFKIRASYDIDGARYLYEGETGNITYEKEKFQHLIFDFHRDYIKIYKNKILQFQHNFTLFDENVKQYVNLEQHYLGLDFEKNNVCRFDMSDYTYSTEIVDMNFLYDLSDTTLFSNKSMRCYNTATFDVIECKNIILNNLNIADFTMLSKLKIKYGNNLE